MIHTETRTTKEDSLIDTDSSDMTGPPTGNQPIPVRDPKPLPGSERPGSAPVEEPGQSEPQHIVR